jgi:hypothetical protein
MNTRKFGLKLLKKAQKLKRFHPELREGQAIIIQLCRMNERYFRNLPNECNCYEDDSKIPALLQYIASKKIK